MNYNEFDLHELSGRKMYDYWEAMGLKYSSVSYFPVGIL